MIVILNNKKWPFLLIAFLLLTVGYSNAQNFAGDDVEDSRAISSDDELTDEVIEQILINEGIPLTPPSNLDLEDVSKYTVGIDDVISIKVLRHPEVSGGFLINRDGKIQYEFVGDIEIVGLTKTEIKELLTEKLNKFIISPDITVKITGYNSKVVYIIGEVGRPGKIFMRGDTITIREALVQGGLPLLTAKATNGRLITPSEDGKAKQVKVNVHKLLYEGDLRENLIMQPGDTLYLPPTMLAKALRAIQPVAAPIGTGARTGRTLTTGF